MYLVDSNVLITAKNAHYGMDFAPGFWEWLEDAHARGKVFSVEAVRDELKGGEDELADWVRGVSTSFWLPPDEAAFAELGRLTAWASSNPQYKSAAKATFLDSADYFLVGQAKALGFSVVTHERPAPEAKARIKIPEACAALTVNYCLPWAMLRDEGARLNL